MFKRLHGIYLGALFENDKTRCSCDNKGIYLKTERLHANIDRDKKFM